MTRKKQESNHERVQRFGWAIYSKLREDQEYYTSTPIDCSFREILRIRNNTIRNLMGSHAYSEYWQLKRWNQVKRARLKPLGFGLGSGCWHLASLD